MIDIALCMALIDDVYEQSAFERLYLDNRQNAYAVAYKILHDEALAEDAVSETFLQIAKVFDKISHQDMRRLHHYVASATRNTALNMLKKEKRSAENISFSDDVLYNYDSQSSDANAELKRCIAKLTYTDHEILYLRISRELKFSEISSLLGISQTAARQRFWVAKNNLKKIIEKEAQSDE